MKRFVIFNACVICSYHQFFMQFKLTFFLFNYIVIISTFSLFHAVTKPGKCPTIEIPDPPYPCARPTHSCIQDCDCPGNGKCCRRTFCGGYKCGPPVPGTLGRRMFVLPTHHILNNIETYIDVIIQEVYESIEIP